MIWLVLQLLFHIVSVKSDLTESLEINLKHKMRNQQEDIAGPNVLIHK